VGGGGGAWENLHESISFQTTHSEERNRTSSTLRVVAYLFAVHVTNLSVAQTTQQQIELVPQPAYGNHTITAKQQRNTNTHRTRAIQPMK